LFCFLPLVFITMYVFYQSLLFIKKGKRHPSWHMTWQTFGLLNGSRQQVLLKIKSWARQS